MTAVKTSVKTDAQVSHLADNGLPVTSADVRRLVAEKKALEDALRPFAEAADGRRSKGISGSVCFGQELLLRARAALDGRKDSKP